MMQYVLTCAAVRLQAVCGKCSKVSESRNIRVCKPCSEALQGAEGTAGGGAEPKRKLEVMSATHWVIIIRVSHGLMV